MKEILLTRGYIAFVDDEDFYRAMQFSWHPNVKPNSPVYAVTTLPKWYLGKRIHTSLHRFIMNAEKGVILDHKDGNGLNCCKSNLRICTDSQNRYNARIGSRNTSGYKGVSWFSQTNCWRASIQYDKTFHHLGYFKDLQDAVNAYREAAIKYHGEFHNF